MRLFRLLHIIPRPVRIVLCVLLGAGLLLATGMRIVEVGSSVDWVLAAEVAGLRRDATAPLWALLLRFGIVLVIGGALLLIGIRLAWDAMRERRTARERDA